MKIINAGYRIMKPDVDDPKTYPDILRSLTEIGHTAYKSDAEVTDDKAEAFAKRLIRDGHESVLEHESIRVKFIVDRGISHELVRHRLAAFTQESTRFCCYDKDKFGNEITVIEPMWYAGIPKERKELIRYEWNLSYEEQHYGINDFNDLEQRYGQWYIGCKEAEENYMAMLYFGAAPQEARNVLPTSLKTEVVMTANLREWRHILSLRAVGTTGKPHPQMQEVMLPLLAELYLKMPALFEDIVKKGDEV